MHRKLNLLWSTIWSLVGLFFVFGSEHASAVFFVGAKAHTPAVDALWKILGYAQQPV